MDSGQWPVWGTALWKPLWEFEGRIEVRHVDAHQKNPLPGSEGDWNKQADIPVCSLEVATWAHEISGHEDCMWLCGRFPRGKALIIAGKSD